jgi:hypothetical protein
MTTINDGGPAFPVPEVFDERRGEVIQYGWSGMTLRDYFAAKAMQGFAADTAAGWPDGSEGMARCAYDWADSMLKARGVKA